MVDLLRKKELELVNLRLEVADLELSYWMKKLKALPEVRS